MIYTARGYKIDAYKIGLPIHEYPVWFTDAIKNGRIVIKEGMSDRGPIVSQVKCKSVYGGIETGLCEKDYICKGPKGLIFVLRNILLEALFTK